MTTSPKSVARRTLPKKGDSKLGGFRCAAFSIAVALLTTNANAELVVVIGTFSDAMSAEAACKVFKEGKTTVTNRAAGMAMCESVRDPKHLAARVDGEVMSELATNPRCKGVTVVSQLLNYDVDDNFKSNPAVPDLIARNDYWELDVDYWPVGQSYSWALWPYASTQTMARTGRDRRDGMVLGDDTPARIADRVCTVVTGQGANVR